MFATELREKARLNPEQYENKRYVVVNGSGFGLSGNCIENIIVIGGKIYDEEKPFSGAVAIWQDTQLEEIKQPVPWQEAIAAWAKGKTIWCEYHDEARTYSKDISEDQNGQMMNRLEIKNGTWYIED